MSHTDDHEGTRRDFLYYATGGTAAVATGAVVLPLVNQMNPSADVLALASIRVDISGISPGTQLTVKWQGKPVFIRHRTEEEIEAGRAVGTGEIYDIPADVVVACIGYRTSPIPGIPFDERAGRFANDEGRILPGIYCVGWARRGPSGTIGTNRPDGYSLIEKIVEDADSGALGRANKAGREGFDALAASRKLDVVTFQDWKKIEEAEAAAALAAPTEEDIISGSGAFDDMVSTPESRD